MREALKKARMEAGLTQEKMAEKLEISLRHYKYIESGGVLGAIWIWDALEDITGIHQRTLRVISDNHHDRANNR